VIPIRHCREAVSPRPRDAHVTPDVTGSRRPRPYGLWVITDVVVSTPLQSTVSLFDGFELRCRGQRVELPMVAQRLVAFVAVHDRPLLRAYVAGTLWPDKTDARSLANLRSVLWRLRQPEAGLVQSWGSHIALADSVEVDVRRLVRLTTDLLAGGEGVPSADANALLTAGEFLPGWYDDWVLAERERLRQLRQHAMEAMCARLTELGRHGEAVDVGLAAVGSDPLRESARTALIAAHFAEGNAAEAIRQYKAYRVLLWKSLQVKPGAKLQAFVAACLHPSTRMAAPDSDGFKAMAT
jgi:DNA-binding SARP family transcriptional activator